MRNLLLNFIVVGFCLTALISPQACLMGYYWFALMRPDFLAYSGPNAYSFAMAVCALGAGLPTRLTRLSMFLRNPILILALFLQVVYLLSVFFAVKPELCYPVLALYSRMVLMAFLIPVLIENFDQMRMMVLVIAGSLGLLGAKFGLFGVIHGGVRFAEGYGGMMSDNNTLALALAMCVPLLWYARSMVESILFKGFFALLFVLNIAAVVMTYSRGAALAMAVGMALIIWRSKYRLVMSVAIVVFTLAAVSFMGGNYIDRIKTLKDPTSEASANSRVILAGAALSMWADHPVLGVGFGKTNQQELLSRYLIGFSPAHEGKVIHNTYLQILVDSGIFAFLLFIMLMLTTFVWLQRAIKQTKARSPGMEAYPMAIQTSLLVFAIDAVTLSRAEFDFFYILIALAAVLYEVQRNWQSPVETGEDAETVLVNTPRIDTPIPAPPRLKMGRYAPPPFGRDPRC